MSEQHANGSRVSHHRLVADATVGVIANPMSGRDIRRLVASASVSPNVEKASMVVWADGRRGSARGGPALVSTGTFGVSAAVQPELFTQVGAGMRYHAMPVRADHDPTYPLATLHLRGAFHLTILGPSSSPRIPSRTGGPVLLHADQLRLT